MACTRRWCLGTRVLSPRPVVPSSPVRVAIWCGVVCPWGSLLVRGPHCAGRAISQSAVGSRPHEITPGAPKCWCRQQAAKVLALAFPVAVQCKACSALAKDDLHETPCPTTPPFLWPARRHLIAAMALGGWAVRCTAQTPPHRPKRQAEALHHGQRDAKLWAHLNPPAPRLTGRRHQPRRQAPAPGSQGAAAMATASSSSTPTATALSREGVRRGRQALTTPRTLTHR